MLMKQLLVVLTAGAIWMLVFVQCDLQAQGWEWLNPLPQGNDLNIVQFVDKQHGWIWRF